MKTPITRVLTSMVVILAVAVSWSLLAASAQEGEEERKEVFTMVAVPTSGSARVTIDSPCASTSSQPIRRPLH